MPSAPGQREPIRIRTNGAGVVLELTNLLDAHAGAALVTATNLAVEMSPDRVDIDLRCLQSWTQDGASSLVRCREICSDLPDGLHYRTGRGPGRAALLAAYT